MIFNLQVALKEIWELNRPFSEDIIHQTKEKIHLTKGKIYKREKIISVFPIISQKSDINHPKRWIPFLDYGIRWFSNLFFLIYLSGVISPGHVTLHVVLYACQSGRPSVRPSEMSLKCPFLPLCVCVTYRCTRGFVLLPVPNYQTFALFWENAVLHNFARHHICFLWLLQYIWTKKVYRLTYHWWNISKES